MPAPKFYEAWAGYPSIPAEVIEAERTLSRWFAQQNIKNWKLGGSQARQD